MIMNKAFIFDWSGTLNDDFHCFCQVCDLIFAEYGIETLSKEEVRSNFETPYMKFWNKYIHDLSKEKQCELYEKYIHQVDEPIVYPKVVEIIQSLHHAGWYVFVLSSNPISKLMPEVEKAGLVNFLEDVIGDVHHKGPVIQSIIQEFKLNKNMTYHVGDSAGDVEAGKFAGVKTIGISWGYQNRRKLSVSQPDFLIDNVSEITNII